METVAGSKGRGSRRAAPVPPHASDASARPLPHGPFDRILVVSEDAFFIEEVKEKIGAEGGNVIACLGPATSPCVLEREDACPLAEGCGFVLVDAPEDGVFRYHSRDLPAGTYAERVQRAHPSSYVILIAPPDARVGTTGEVAPVGRRSDALNIVTWILRSDAAEQGPDGRHLQAVPAGAVGSTKEPR